MLLNLTGFDNSAGTGCWQHFLFCISILYQR